MFYINTSQKKMNRTKPLVQTSFQITLHYNYSIHTKILFRLLFFNILKTIFNILYVF